MKIHTKYYILIHQSYCINCQTKLTHYLHVYRNISAELFMTGALDNIVIKFIQRGEFSILETLERHVPKLLGL